ncbi:MAG: hypothetical protein J5958_02750 [Clostridia bacterium]|nr:hypothetical protein [Clostridia bacterium]MBR5043849.1 hypothetical protein [Clostridia bacterium]
MIENDTVRLLRECDAGIRMGVDSINEVIDKVKGDSLRDTLTHCREEHESLGNEVQGLLDEYRDGGKKPNPVAKSMSWIKTNVEIAMDRSDETIASLMTDGCNMGVKSLSRYLNQYAAADERSKSVARRLIALESDTAVSMRGEL